MVRCLVGLLSVSMCLAAVPELNYAGSIDAGVVAETTPIVIGGDLYVFESIHAKYHGNELSPGREYFRFSNYATGMSTPPFAKDYALGSAFAYEGNVYAYGRSCSRAHPQCATTPGSV